MKSKYVDLWASFVTKVATLSNCKRLKVGAALVSLDGERMLAYGFNGDWAGGPNEYEDEVPGDPRFVHAEMNCLARPRHHEPCAIFTNITPCLTCATLIINAKVSQVYSLVEYRDPKGIQLLRLALGESNVIILGNKA